MSLSANVRGVGVVQKMRCAHKVVSEEPAKEPYSRARIEEDISICLGCKRARCTWLCKDILESRRAIAHDREEGR